MFASLLSAMILIPNAAGTSCYSCPTVAGNCDAPPATITCDGQCFKVNINFFKVIHKKMKTSDRT